MDSVETQVRKLIIDVLDVNEAQVIDTATIREDLGADSLDVVQLIVACSNLFDIEIDDVNEMRQLQTFGDITTYIAHRSTPLLSTSCVLSQKQEQK